MKARVFLQVALTAGLLVLAAGSCGADDPIYHAPGSEIDLDRPIKATVAKPNLFFVGGVQIKGTFTALCDGETGITYINGIQWMPPPKDCPQDESRVGEEMAERLSRNSTYLRNLVEDGTFASWSEALALSSSMWDAMTERARQTWIRVQRDEGGSVRDAREAVLAELDCPLLDPGYEPHFRGNELYVKSEALEWEEWVSMPDPFWEPPPPPTPEELQDKAELWLRTIIAYLQNPQAKCVILYSCYTSMIETGGRIGNLVDHLRRCFEAGRYLEPEPRDYTLGRLNTELILKNTRDLDVDGW